MYSRASTLRALFVLISAMCALYFYLLLPARGGKVRVYWFMVDRSKSPFSFWMAVLTYAAGATFLLCMLGTIVYLYFTLDGSGR